MGGVRGDFGELKALRLALARLSSPAARMDIKRVCAEAAVKVTDDEFNTSTDPYGKPWAPLTSREGKPLLDTGTHLRKTLNPKVTATGFRISTAFKGAPVHQYGAKIFLPARVAVRGKSGRFMSKKRANKAKRGTVVRAGTIKGHYVTIPQRQYMPEGELGPRWSEAIRRAADTALRNAMGAK